MPNTDDSPAILLPVEKTTELKSWLVDYVGEKLQPEKNEVNVEMIIQVMAEEFPEILLAIAEENFVRGYQQAAEDIRQFEVPYEKPDLEVASHESLMERTEAASLEDDE